MKTGSFCSITSEGDGDIFSEDANCGGCGPSPASISSQPRGSTSSSGKYDPLSDYSEWQNEDTRSDISELFQAKMTPTEASPLLEAAAQPLPSAETLSANSSSLDEITYEVPTTTVLTPKVTRTSTSEVNLEAEVSSVSLSIGRTIRICISVANYQNIYIFSGSEDNNQLITVPVTIEHPPPELRTSADNSTQSHHHHQHSQPQKVEAGCQQVTPASIAHHLGPSMTCMTSTGDLASADATEACGGTSVAVSVSASAKGASMAASASELQQPMAVDAMAVAAASANLEPGMKMVLVRDIGIQVSGDSPNLNLARKFKQGSPHHHHHHHHHHQKASSSTKQDSLAEKFPAEILF